MITKNILDGCLAAGGQHDNLELNPGGVSHDITTVIYEF
jgi:hypothetical protein